jgi:hypothetical protein
LRGLYAQLGLLGVKYLMFECNVYVQNNQVNAANDVKLCRALLQDAPGCILGIEGCNEYDGWHFMLNSKDSYGNMPWGADDAQQLASAVSADSLMHDVMVVAPSALDQANTPNYGNIVDAINAHCYSQTGQQLQASIQAGLSYVRSKNPNKPVFITETGVSTGGYNSSSWSGGDETAQAIMNLNAVLTGFANGTACTYLYELRNWLNNGNGSANQDNFGLYDTNGNIKPAGEMLSNLRAIMADNLSMATLGHGHGNGDHGNNGDHGHGNGDHGNGDNCGNGGNGGGGGGGGGTEPPIDGGGGTEPPIDPPVEPPIDPPVEPPIDPPVEPPVDGGGDNQLPDGSLDVTLTGMPSTAASILLQKSDGTMQVVIWNPGAKISNGSSTIMPPTSEVTVKFGQPWYDIAVYDPAQGSDPISVDDETDTVTVYLDAYPKIVEIPA